jgi:hypothetical protein
MSVRARLRGGEGLTGRGRSLLGSSGFFPSLGEVLDLPGGEAPALWRCKDSAVVLLTTLAACTSSTSPPRTSTTSSAGCLHDDGRTVHDHDYIRQLDDDDHPGEEVRLLR